MNVYVIEKGVGTFTLPAKKFDPTTGATSDVVSCSFSEPTGDSGACVTCDSLVYLDATSIQKANIAGVTVASASSKDEAKTVGNLSNDKAYWVFLQYEPGGLKPSQCMTGLPSANFSFTELNGEGNAEAVDFRCFIATAAYGTTLHKDVALFRSFRDHALLPTWAGRLLVATYYRVSPPIASFIATHPRVQSWVRARLEAVATWLRAEGYTPDEKN